jgi:tetratricopeptide (TPR) repeat protein
LKSDGCFQPSNAREVAYWGDIEWKNKNPVASLSVFKLAIQGNRDLRIVYIDLGALYMQQKNYQEAQAALIRAVQLSPELPDAHYQLGRLYQIMGNTADAEKELGKVRELHENAEESLVGKMPASQAPANPAVH